MEGKEHWRQIYIYIYIYIYSYSEREKWWEEDKKKRIDGEKGRQTERDPGKDPFGWFNLCWLPWFSGPKCCWCPVFQFRLGRFLFSNLCLMDLSALMQFSPCLQLSIFKMLLSECSACVFFSQLLFFKLKLSINHTDENQWISKKSLSMIIIPPNVWLLFAFISVVLMFFQSSTPIFFYRCAQFPLLRVWNVTVDQLLVIWMQMSLTWIANIFYKFMHFWHTHRKNTNPEIWKHFAQLTTIINVLFRDMLSLVWG